MDWTKYCALAIKEDHHYDKLAFQKLICGHFICNGCSIQIPHKVIEYSIFCRFCYKMTLLKENNTQIDKCKAVVEKYETKLCKIKNNLKADVLGKAECLIDEMKTVTVM